MKKREKWAIIDVVEVIKGTSVEKVMKCYDFKSWERDEILNIENNTNLTLNEFRWDYVRGTLEITDETFSDIGYMVKDLIEDIKMGYHRISDKDILMDIENSDKVNNLYNDAKEMKFEYIPYRDYETNEICAIEIYYDDNELSYSEKEREIQELFTYLELKDGQALIVK